MNDPTYNRKEIKQNPVWETAFIMSECLNEGAPLDWGRYIWVAEALDKAGLIVKTHQTQKTKERKRR